MHRQNLAFLAIGLSALLGLPALDDALAGHRTGNGGDPLRLVFAKAKNDAELTLAASDPAVDIVIPEEPANRAVVLRVQAFLLEPYAGWSSRRLAMISDIHESVHEWVYEEADQPTCAWTNRDGDDARIIHLSIPFCRTLLTESDLGPAQAVRQLIHESTHHVGLTSDADEVFADDVAMVVYQAWERKRDLSRPHWSAMAAMNGPDMRFLHSTVWTGTNSNNSLLDRKLLVWGGCNFALLMNHEDCAHNLNSGATLDLAGSDRGQWSPLPDNGAPTPRRNQIALWTGNATGATVADAMLIFGGCRGQNDADMTCSNTLRDGGLYYPASREWRAIEPLPSNYAPRVFGASGWTGTELMMWGGLANFDRPGFAATSVGDGARLVFDGDPLGRWVSMASEGAPTARHQTSTVAGGRTLYISGGCTRPGFLLCRQFTNEIAIYNAAADTPGQSPWEITHPSNAFLGRAGHSLVLAAERYLIMWGGVTTNGYAGDGIMYDLQTKEWTEIPALLPTGESARTDHHAFWDVARRRMVVWGGQYPNRAFAQSTIALEFSADFGTHTWRHLATDVAPIGRKGATGIWTGAEFLIWGGFGDQYSFLDVGDILRLP